MIPASHTPLEDIGIHFFGPDGFRLTPDRRRNASPATMGLPRALASAEASMP